MNVSSEILVFNFGHFITVVAIFAALFSVLLNDAQKFKLGIFYHSYKAGLKIYFLVYI